jgi:hypothetical protein
MQSRFFLAVIKSRYLLLFFIPAYFLMDGINRFRGLIPFSTGLKVMALSCVLSIMLAKLIQRKLDAERSIIITAWILFCYLFFKIILEKLTIFKPLPKLISVYFYFPFFSVLFLVLLYFLRKLQLKSRQLLLTYLTILFAVFLIVEAVKFFYPGSLKKQYVLNTEKTKLQPLTSQLKPNIYLLVLDEYAGFESVKEYFKFDNTPFADSLRKRKFFVAQNPNSNYNMTWVSMLATLEMNYITNYNKKEFTSMSIYAKAAEAIKENNLTGFLYSNGYTIVNNTFFRLNHSESKSALTLPIEERLLMNNTFGRTLFNGVLQNIPSNKLHLLLNTEIAKIYRYNEITVQSTYETIQRNYSPCFLYSHFLMPHLPYLKDKNGTVRKFSDTYRELRMYKPPAAYIDYMHYTNRLILNMTDSIIKKNNNSIVIVMSDHGYRWIKENRKKKHDFNNFFAVYSSNGNYNGFTDSTCSLNIFRILLNQHFNQQLPMLKNELIDVSEGHLYFVPGQ